MTTLMQNKDQLLEEAKIKDQQIEELNNQLSNAKQRETDQKKIAEDLCEQVNRDVEVITQLQGAAARSLNQLAN